MPSLVSADRLKEIAAEVQQKVRELGFAELWAEIAALEGGLDIKPITPADARENVIRSLVIELNKQLKYGKRLIKFENDLYRTEVMERFRAAGWNVEEKQKAYLVFKE